MTVGVPVDESFPSEYMSVPSGQNCRSDSEYQPHKHEPETLGLLNLSKTQQYYDSFSENTTRRPCHWLYPVKNSPRLQFYQKIQPLREQGRGKASTKWVQFIRRITRPPCLWLNWSSGFQTFSGTPHFRISKRLMAHRLQFSSGTFF